MATEFWRLGDSVTIPVAEGGKASGRIVGFVWAPRFAWATVYVRFDEPRHHHDAQWLNLPGELNRPEPCRAFYAGTLYEMTRKAVA